MVDGGVIHATVVPAGNGARSVSFARKAGHPAASWRFEELNGEAAN
jgi:hypothetical protein